MDITLEMPPKINTNIPEIEKLLHTLDVGLLPSHTNIYLDFSRTFFVSNELTAALSASVLQWINDEHQVFLGHMKPEIHKAFSKNGFLKLFNIEEPIDDTYKTTLPIFMDYSQNETIIYQYLYNNVFNSPHWPKTQSNSNLKIEVINSAIFEMARNINEHSGSNELFMCGQFYPQKQTLGFTLVDNGISIPTNVSTHIPDLSDSTNSEIIDWSTQKGNSTKETAASGLGLYDIKTSLLNFGELTIFSNNGIWKQTSQGKIIKKEGMAKKRGTLIHISFNLSDINPINRNETRTSGQFYDSGDGLQF